VVWTQLDDFDLSPGKPVMVLDPHDIKLAGDISGSFAELDPAPF